MVRWSKPIATEEAGYRGDWRLCGCGRFGARSGSDLRVVEQTATMGVFCRRWGVPLIDGGTFRLARIVGFGVAMDLILTGRAVDADEAFMNWARDAGCAGRKGDRGGAGAGPRNR